MILSVWDFEGLNVMVMVPSNGGNRSFILFQIDAVADLNKF